MGASGPESPLLEDGDNVVDDGGGRLALLVEHRCRCIVVKGRVVVGGDVPKICSSQAGVKLRASAVGSDCGGDGMGDALKQLFAKKAEAAALRANEDKKIEKKL